MPLFRRKPNADPRPAIARFWSWWADHRAQVVAAYDGGRSDEVAALLRPAVAAIDAGLEWQLGPSATKRFTVVLSAGGSLDLRAIAERWALTAPDDPDAQFAAVRHRDPVLLASVMKVDDFDIDLRELIAGTRFDRERGAVDVVVHHPLFPLLDKDSRMRVARLGLDAALGEDDVGQWIGVVGVAADAPIDAIPLASLADVVDQLRPPPGQWTTLRGMSRKGPVLVTVRLPLRRVERPLADTHVAVAFGYEARSDGLPVDDAVSAEVEKVEERLVAALGGDGPHVIHVGRVTGAGQVVVHLYVDGFEVDVAPVRPVMKEWHRGTASVEVINDPEWQAVAPLAG